MAWPQLIFLGLYALTIFTNLAKHGEWQVREYNAFGALIGAGVGALILWWGGFWAPLGLPS